MPPDRSAPGRGPDVTELFRAHHLELVRLALLMVGDLGTAEDVVQDTFEQLHRRWHLLTQAFTFGRIDDGALRALPGASADDLYAAAAW